MVKRFCDRCGFHLEGEYKSIHIYGFDSIRGEWDTLDLCLSCATEVKIFLKIK